MNDIERRTLLGAAGIGALAALSKAGPLEPPGGPVAPTGRTLEEVYNRIPPPLPNGSGDGRVAIPGGTSSITIALPGSYFLTGNLESSATVINILSDDITLDLNGYRVACANTTAYGINIGGVSSRTGITIRNGSLWGGQAGVFAVAPQSGVLLEDLRITRARSNGISFTDTGSRGCVVRRCHIIDTGATTTAADLTTAVTAINLSGDGHRVQECTVSRLFNLTPAGTVRGIAINGAGANSGVLVERCYITHDVSLTATGLSMSPGGVYRDNTVSPGISTPYLTANNTDGGGNV